VFFFPLWPGGMPALLILGFVGIAPIRRTPVGMVEGDAKKRDGWIERLRRLGAQGA
jgi:putative NADPH-quinone reductase